MLLFTSSSSSSSSFFAAAASFSKPVRNRAALDLLGGVLPRPGHGWVGHLAERRGRVDRDDLHGLGAIPAGGRTASPRRLCGHRCDHAEDLSGVQVHGGCHLRLGPGPRPCDGSWKWRTNRNQCSAVPSICGQSLSTSGNLNWQASVTLAQTIHQDTAKPAAASETARLERMTPFTSWSHRRAV